MSFLGINAPEKGRAFGPTNPPWHRGSVSAAGGSSTTFLSKCCTTQMLLDVDSCRLKFYARSTWDKTLFVRPGKMKTAIHRVAKRITARMLAWVLLLSGLTWFVAVSPKTPVQFFDAANRDRYVIDSLTKQTGAENPDHGAVLLEQWSEVRRDKERIALLFDMTNDPTQIQRERSSIIIGCYDASPETQNALAQTDGAYRSLQAQFEQLRADLKASRSTTPAAMDSRQKAKKDPRLRRRLFQEEVDRTLLRQFQANIFWRERE